MEEEVASQVGLGALEDMARLWGLSVPAQPADPDCQARAQALVQRQQYRPGLLR